MDSKIPKALREVGYEMYCDAEKLGSLDIPVVEFEIKDLIWNFDLPLWGKDGESWNLTPWDVINKAPGSANQRKRVENVDMSYPILITKENERWLIIDGVHRLAKAHLDNQQTIRAKIISKDLIEKYPWNADSKNINESR
ncbi:MAG: hypothetical protein LiPW41_766 [Parcubacteria group bacterium LiPW_41]|nr:MAG: hypothetical protein LiPW41_766 [Parcubacteria group bacterium LiPW_41]